ncbi:MAG: ABC transporter ATP-binding protein [Candidatus Kapaibacteriota bacterium]
MVATGIGKSYRMPGHGLVRVLHQANIQVQSGEFVAVVGPSGSGKSTLLHILATLDQPDEGTVVYTVDNASFIVEDLSVDVVARLRNSEIGMVFQAHHLLPEFTVLENVMMPALIAGSSHADAYARAVALVERVGMAHRTEHSPQELSGGEQQRTAIARALINRPRFLFADEPTGNLDHLTAEAIIEMMTDLQRDHHLTCVIATHSRHVAERADRVVHLRDGHVLEGDSE